MQVPFYKYEGLGNDFIVVDEADLQGDAIGVDQARALCDRHRGIGADGVLLINRGDKNTMRVINSDGSQPQMCGNGLRCVAWHWARTAGLEGDIEVATGAGVHLCEVVSSEGTTSQVHVQMAVPSFATSDIGLRADGPWIDQSVTFGGESLSLTAVSMGNPHAVTFDTVRDPRIVGPLIQGDARFSQGVNVGFATLRGPTHIELLVLERGAGWTQACGTGACAAVAVGVETGRVPEGEAIQVTLPGGDLNITSRKNQPVSMTGPARFVFDGRFYRD